MYAVFIGGCLGHFCCTLAAIIFGAAIAKKVSMTVCKLNPHSPNMPSRDNTGPTVTVQGGQSNADLYSNFSSVNLCGGLLFLGFSGYTFYLAATNEND